MIRPRREDDLPRLVALLRAVHDDGGYPANWPKRPVEWIAARGTLAAWVIEEDGDLAGHVALTRPDPDRSSAEWEAALGVAGERLAVIRRLFVSPAWRRRGFGTLLMDRAVREAHERGLHPVLDVADHNQAAIAFWEGHGWHQIGEAALPPGDEGRPLRLLLYASQRPPAR